MDWMITTTVLLSGKTGLNLLILCSIVSLYISVSFQLMTFYRIYSICISCKLCLCSMLEALQLIFIYYYLCYFKNY